MSGTDEPRPDRMGLEAFDQVDPPDQWSEIVARSVAPATMRVDAPGEPSRRGWARWGAGIAASVLVVAVVVALAVRSDESSAPATVPEDTLAPPGTVEPGPATTVTGVDPVPTTDPVATPPTPATAPPSSADVTEPTAPPSTEPVVGSTRWAPPCTDVAGDPSASHAPDPRLATFSTFALSPALDLEIPLVTDADEPNSPLVTPARIADGVVVVLRETVYGDDGAVDVASIVAVDLDGSIRWRRCLDGAGYAAGLLVGPDGERGAAWITFVGPGGGVRVEGFDLSTGASLEPATPVGERSLVTSDRRRALLGLPTDAPPVTADDVLVVFAAADGGSTEIPYPELALGRGSTEVGLGLVELDDGFAVTAYTVGNDAVEAYVDGEWTDEPDQLRRLPPRLDLFSGDGLMLVDGAGDVVWRDPDYRPISREGFHSAIAESVVVAVDCPNWTLETGCGVRPDGETLDERLVGYDLATGAELWSRDGGVAFAAIAGDRGIVTADIDGDGAWDRWELIDLRTGRRVDDQPVTEWPGQGWTNACCGEGDYAWTLLDGGLLFESTGWRLRVWLPPDASSPTTAVALHD